MIPLSPQPNIVTVTYLRLDRHFRQSSAVPAKLTSGIQNDGKPFTQFLYKHALIF
ncbi:hypothetical protein FHS21_005105 [Phyllobacterium trifolii]|jgi:hypothetical protein|uniref:Uncharacterized protein n=1 Tax=Phyllobacterium trifolii TaxID=300193 RepID=A0A839UDR7_9HYPH|nr:hypothetical protein [Phyllobacterium trifolii]